MLHFFRKIRQSLLNNGKTAKYLTYALGEIVLVVFGILIALQINNWNEKKKETKELQNYLIKIADNIQQDIIQVESLKIRRDSVRSKATKSSKALLKNDFANIRDILQGQRAFYEFYFIPNKSGFEALKNSSYLGKINNTKIDSLLSLYYARVDKTYNDELSYNVFIENMEVQLSTSVDRTPLSILFDKITNGNVGDINEMKDLLPYIQHNAFKSAVFRTVGERTYLGNYPKILEIGNELIKEINLFCKIDTQLETNVK